METGPIAENSVTYLLRERATIFDRLEPKSSQFYQEALVPVVTGAVVGGKNWKFRISGYSGSFKTTLLGDLYSLLHGDPRIVNANKVAEANFGTTQAIFYDDFGDYHSMVRKQRQEYGNPFPQRGFWTPADYNQIAERAALVREIGYEELGPAGFLEENVDWTALVYNSEIYGVQRGNPLTHLIKQMAYR